MSALFDPAPLAYGLRNL